MPTKTDSDTGWTDQYPHKADAGDEYYFVRRKDRSDVVIMGFSMGQAWLNGVSYDPAEMRSLLFLGPLSPSDFEQLIRLRTAITEALEAIDDAEAAMSGAEAHCPSDLAIALRGRGQRLRNRAKELREALATTGEQSCASQKTT